MNRSALDQLNDLRRRHRSLVRSERMWRGVAVWLCATAGFVMADVGWAMLGSVGSDDPFAVVQLPGWMRWAMTLSLAAGIVAVMQRWRLPLEVLRSGLDGYARNVERATGLKGNELVNAVQLVETANAKPQAADGFRGELAKRTVAHADAIAAKLAWDAMLDERPMRTARRQAATAGAMCVVIALVLQAISGNFAGELIRFVDPSGDHPPMAAAKLELTRETTADGDVRLRLTVRGDEPEAARVKWDDGSTLPMNKQEDGSFELTLHQPDAPAQVRAEAAGTWTAWMAVAAELDRGEPVNGTSTSQGHSQGVEASKNGAQGENGNGAGGTAEGETPMMSPAVGALLDRIASAEQRERMTRLVEQAPAEYREQVARYLMSIEELR